MELKDLLAHQGLKVYKGKMDSKEKGVFQGYRVSKAK